MIYTVVGPRFQIWVQECIKQRDEKLTEDRNLNLELDPQVASFFSQSTSVSSKCYILNQSFNKLNIIIVYLLACNGSAVNLLKPNVQRRRTKAQVIADRVEKDNIIDQHKDF